MNLKIVASTALVALIVSTSMAFADTEVTRGSIECHNTMVLLKNVPNNSITLTNGIVIEGNVPATAGIIGTDIAHTKIIAGDQLQLCVDRLVNEDATHSIFAGVINDITAQMDVAGYFTFVTPSKNA